MVSTTPICYVCDTKCIGRKREIPQNSIQGGQGVSRVICALVPPGGPSWRYYPGTMLFCQIPVKQWRKRNGTIVPVKIHYDDNYTNNDATDAAADDENYNDDDNDYNKNNADIENDDDDDGKTNLHYLEQFMGMSGFMCCSMLLVNKRNTHMNKRQLVGLRFAWAPFMFL